jgi:fructan beta-fructosidase
MSISCNNESTSKGRSEKYRSQIHFSPKSGWMNDPNGLVYYEGEYHLFFQYYPNGTQWGPMHWGHAVSNDLIHWEELPIALEPDELGWIFSGSAVVDYKNTSGLGQNGIAPLIAIYTYHNPQLEKEGSDEFQYQGLAYSLDKGRTWKKYLGNPVLPNNGIRDFRDPKIFWNESIDGWNMVLAVKDHINIYSSRNLIEWSFESEFGVELGSHEGVWECPDLFPMKIENSDEVKWVMLVSLNNGAPNGGSGTQYFVGDFDGRDFISNSEKVTWLDYGKDNYAGVTWNDLPENDERRLFIGWMNNWQYANEIPSTNWRGTSTIPRTLSLEKKQSSYLLKSEVVDEFKSLRGKSFKLSPDKIVGEQHVNKEIDSPVELNIEFKTSNNSQLNYAERFGLILSNDQDEMIKIGYDNYNKAFFIDKSKNGWNSTQNNFAELNYAPYIINEDVLELRLIIDKASVELFAQDGLITMTDQFFPKQPYNKIILFSENGEVDLLNAQITNLKSIWEK